MSFEEDYYKFERFWNNYDYSYEINIEKIRITFDFLKDKPFGSLLDAACGNGIFTNMAAERWPDARIMGFDRSETALSYVKTQKTVASIDDIPFEDAEFDCVIAHDVIEHLPVSVYYKAIEEIARVSRKYIVVGVPYRENLKDNVSECPNCFSHFNNDLHFRSFDDNKMKGLFTMYGFRCTDLRTCNTNRFLYGRKTYGRLFYPKWQKAFRSPICPLCGYLNPADRDPQYKIGDESAGTSSGGIKSYLKKIILPLWPKYDKDYEMVALFEKTK